MISPFEYVTVLISIILGLGITQILVCVAELFHKIERVKFYWPHTLWILFLLVLQVQDWWVMYELKNYQPWRLPTFLFIMLYPICLFVLARLLCPDKLEENVIDLKAFYLKHYRKIFVLFIFSAVHSIAYNLLILGLEWTTQVLQVLLILTFTGVVIRGNVAEWFHKLLALAVITTMVITIVVEWNTWLIN